MAVFMILILIYKHGGGVGVFQCLCGSLSFFSVLVVSIEVIHGLGSAYSDGFVCLLCFCCEASINIPRVPFSLCLLLVYRKAIGCVC